MFAATSKRLFPPILVGEGSWLYTLFETLISPPTTIVDVVPLLPIAFFVGSGMELAVVRRIGMPLRAA